MTIRRHTPVIVATLVWGALIFWLNRLLPLDIPLSARFFAENCTTADPRACWFFNKNDRTLSFWLHHLPIDLFTAFGIGAAALLAAGFFKPALARFRPLCLMIVGGLIMVPVAVWALKSAFPHYCPGQLPVFGGLAGTAAGAKVKAFCFPASFPAAGFSLIVIYFGRLKQSWRYAGLAAGLMIGTLQSAIQIARGEHFFSHCLGTLVTAVWIGICLRHLIDVVARRRAAQPHNPAQQL